jgi:hypothetical protein
MPAKIVKPVGSPKRDSTIVAHVGLSLATVIHSLLVLIIVVFIGIST